MDEESIGGHWQIFEGLQTTIIFKTIPSSDAECRSLLIDFGHNGYVAELGVETKFSMEEDSYIIHLGYLIIR